jgi:hypothetical protein
MKFQTSTTAVYHSGLNQDFSKTVPREFSSFQNMVHSELTAMQEAFDDLKGKFKGTQ